MSIKIGEYYKFKTQSTDYRITKHKNEKCLVLRPLTEKECDIADVGMMYKVQFGTNEIIEAFEDELWVIDDFITMEELMDKISLFPELHHRQVTSITWDADGNYVFYLQSLTNKFTDDKFKINYKTGQCKYCPKGIDNELK